MCFSYSRYRQPAREITKMIIFIPEVVEATSRGTTTKILFANHNKTGKKQQSEYKSLLHMASYRNRSEIDNEVGLLLQGKSEDKSLEKSVKVSISTSDLLLKNSELESLVASLRVQVEHLKDRVKVDEDVEVLRQIPEPSKFHMILLDRGG